MKSPTGACQLELSWAVAATVGAGYTYEVKASFRVARLPDKPLLIFDGDCNFCSRWVLRWQERAGGRLDTLPSQDGRVALQFPELSPEQLASAVQLVETDGSVYSGAEAVFQATANRLPGGWLLACYARSPVFARVSERAYAFVASHRPLFSRLTRLGWGRDLREPSHRLVQALFLRWLAVIYLIAFVSLRLQVAGLVGSDGILPAKLTLEAVRKQTVSTHSGWQRFHYLPTLCWLDASDGFLKAQCAAGVLLALLVLAGIAPAPCLFGLWLLYLSLVSVGREFLSFQWDAQLLEVGLLAIFFAPGRLLPWRQPRSEPPLLVLWLLRWLLFKLMFASGCVKLLSGDPTWHDLTALTYHYETQPLPTWLGYYAFQLPVWFQKMSAAVMFAIELGMPFLIFAPRRVRLLPCAAFLALQGLIFLTGNYCFFNLLTVGLCLLLLDDASLCRFLTLLPFSRKWLPKPDASANLPPGQDEPGNRPGRARSWRWPGLAAVPLACMVLLTSLVQLAGMFRWNVSWPAPVAAAYDWVSPSRSFNSYGLFAVMTTSRPEIIVQGSNDGVTWRDYGFKYKPGDVNRRPAFVEPHQPRLDWQMWFAALGDYRQNPWFINFCVRLLEGSPVVLALLDHNPFPDRPPRYIRAIVYDYHFAPLSVRRKTGAWWQREEKGEYLPIISLRRSEP